MTKEQAINKIQNTPYVYLNDDQKKIAIGIINSIPSGQDVLAYFDFIMKRADVGFKFDVAPEIATGRIAVVNEMKSHNINTDPKTVDIDENKLIIGDNYEALKNLLLTHKEKVDVIYIDPPYNTEKSKEDGNTSSKEGSASKFIYKDKFGRNGWLNMMRDRLVLAKRLLSPEGVIFVSIDDSEQAYLKVLMDDIFGEENFLSNIVWISNPNGRGDSKNIGRINEYIIAYKKSGETVLKMSQQKVEQFKLIDEQGPYAKQILYSRLSYSKKMDFPIQAPNGEKIFAGNVSKDEWSYRTSNTKGGKEFTWRWSKEKIAKGLEIGEAFFEKNNGVFKLYRKRRPSINGEGAPHKNFFSDEGTRHGSKQLLEIFNSKLFDHPKPTGLLRWLINLCVKKEPLVLDFFAGSGTTAQAVMELNKEDNGNRKFILVTNNENNIGIDITYERIYRVIKGVTTKGSKDFKWLEKNTPFENEKLRVFNIKHFDVETDQSDELENITNMAIENLKKLNPLYKDKDLLQVYYDLDGLNPINESQKEQIYSTDAIKHRISNNVKVSNKKYCTCGKSFIKTEELEKHINKENI